MQLRGGAVVPRLPRSEWHHGGKRQRSPHREGTAPLLEMARLSPLSVRGRSTVDAAGLADSPCSVASIARRSLVAW
jgi:hypothetical protein